MPLELIVSTYEGSEESYVYRFDKPTIQIGRSEAADIQLPSNLIKDIHVAIRMNLGRYELFDPKDGSVQGVFLNGKPVKSQEYYPLSPSDVINVFNFKMVVHLSTRIDSPTSKASSTEMARRMVSELIRLFSGEKGIPTMIVVGGHMIGHIFSFMGGRTEALIGRSSGCDFFLDDTDISREHAYLEFHENQMIIHDLESKNGIIVNGEKIKHERIIYDGDEIVIGSIRLVYRYLPSESIEFQTILSTHSMVLPKKDAKRFRTQKHPMVLKKLSRSDIFLLVLAVLFIVGSVGLILYLLL